MQGKTRIRTVTEAATLLTSAKEGPDANNRRDTKTLEERLKRERIQGGGEADAGGTGKILAVRVSPEFSEGLEKVAGAFGKRLIFIKDEKGDFRNSSRVVIGHSPARFHFSSTPTYR